MSERYISNDATITDTKTGLMWQAQPVGPMTWQEAMDYAESLILDGAGWRLPTIEELVTLIDYGRHDPASSFPGMSFHGLAPSWFWSSSLDADDTDYVWYVDFYDGCVGSSGKTYPSSARCVRGEPKQQIQEPCTCGTGYDPECQGNNHSNR
jgi:hypothetical protein